jgi:hypothetical protein
MNPRIPTTEPEGELRVSHRDYSWNRIIRKIRGVPLDESVHNFHLFQGRVEFVQDFEKASINLFDTGSANFNGCLVENGVAERIRPDEIRAQEGLSSCRSRSLCHLLNGTDVWKRRDQEEARDEVPLSGERDDSLGTEIRLRVKIQANPLRREATRANQDSFEKVYIGLSSGWQKTGILYSALEHS